jgi:hypothetical protein
LAIVVSIGFILVGIKLDAWFDFYPEFYKGPEKDEKLKQD